MPDPYEIFNPDESLRQLVELSIVKRDGSVVDVSNRIVKFVGGANVSLDVEEDESEIEISVSPGVGEESTYWRDKHDKMAGITDANDDGNPVTGDAGDEPYQPAYSFTRKSMWLSTLNGRDPDESSGAIFVLNGPCANIGQFLDNVHPEDVESALSIFDICTPCMDCQTYYVLNEYMQRILAFYDWILALVLNEDTENPPEHPDGGYPETISGLLPQMMTLQRYWDYLVHTSSVKFTAQTVGQAISTAVYYKNISDATIAAPIEVSVEYEFLEDDVPWAGLSEDVVDARVITREGISPNINIDESATVVISVDKTKVTVSADSGAVSLPSNRAAFHDHALLIKSLDAFDDDKEYKVSVTMTIQPTHLDPSTVERTLLIYFKPPDEPPPEPST